MQVRSHPHVPSADALGSSLSLSCAPQSQFCCHIPCTHPEVCKCLPHFYMTNEVFFDRAVFSWMHTQEFPELTAMGSLEGCRAVLPFGTGLVRKQRGHYLG